ncbi:hypothetical protein [Candidatus Palauibacter sp.]|uniref:hypothetical protein n=1 Tax=Candidatus Palauibacter sp. TaxID=3101350 RepID=UPI003B52DFE1
MIMIMTDTLGIWNVAGTWVSALGTVGAVVVSLWLAWQSGRPRVDAVVHLGTPVLGDEPLEKQIVFVVRNTGRMPVRVSGIGWTVGKRKTEKRSFFQLPSDLTNLPTEIPVGQDTTIMAPAGQVKCWFQELDAPTEPLRARIITPLREHAVDPQSDVIAYLSS